MEKNSSHSLEKEDECFQTSKREEEVVKEPSEEADPILEIPEER